MACQHIGGYYYMQRSNIESCKNVIFADRNKKRNKNEVYRSTCKRIRWWSSPPINAHEIGANAFALFTKKPTSMGEQAFDRRKYPTFQREL